MWNNQKLFQGRGFSTPQPPARNPRPMMPMSERKRISPANESDPFHIVHKVPAGDSPYVRAKHVQLIDKDPSKAISLFWAAINSGDRVDSALKDMAIVMKQLDRSDEAIEAIKSFRHLCPYDAQESLDNVLVELYKRSGRVEEEIEMLQLKLKRIEEGIAFGGRRTKTARSQGKKVQISVEQEISRILGNLAWAYLQQNNFSTAEEHYKKALSLEPDKNKQCNLALCLMHMNRLAEAKSLLQAVKASSGNRPMDESYAKSFERALQMLTELESHSVLNPIKQKEGDQNEVNSFGGGGQHSGSAFCRRWADGHDEETTLINENHRGFYQQNHIENKENSFGCSSGTLQCISFGPRSSLQSSPQTMSVDKWKKGPHFESSSERMSSFPTRMKGDCVGSTGTEATAACKSVYSSPTPTRRNLNVPLTQPRRCSWGFSNGHQRREIWGENAVRSSNRKLSFEQSITTQNVQAPGIQDINGDLLASPSPVNGDWRRSCRDLARLKDVTDSQHIVNQSWKRDSFGDGETKKFAMGDSNLSLKVAVEPPMVVDHVRTFIEGEQDQSSGTTVSGHEKPMTTCEGEWFRKNSTGVSDGFHQHIEENSKTAHDNCKKSWADMVEEEEEELLGGRTLMEYYDGWNSDDELNDENLNSNIIYQSPYPQSQSKSLSCKFESFDLKDGYCTSGVALSSRNQTARRSLCFEQQQKPDYICSSPLPKKALNFEGCKSVQANGRDSISRKNEKLIRRNRLQVFREITPHPESP